MVEEDVVLHADAKLFANLISVGLHVFAIHLDRANRWCKEASQERPGHRKRLPSPFYYFFSSFPNLLVHFPAAFAVALLQNVITSAKAATFKMEILNSS